MKPFEYLEHTADIGVRAYGRTAKEAFENAAQGMFSLITDLERVKPEREETVEVEAADIEALLVEWLGELLFRLELEDLLFKEFQVKELSDTRLVARAKGEKIDPQRHPLLLQIKAVTYHMIEVRKNDLWHAQVVFDI